MFIKDFARHVCCVASVSQPYLALLFSLSRCLFPLLPETISPLLLVSFFVFHFSTTCCSYHLFNHLESQEQANRILYLVLYAHEERDSLATVDQTVIVCQRQVHHGARL